MSFRTWTQTYRRVRKGTILLIGGTVLAIGLAMIVTPGPAFLVIPIGLAILGVEYAWARRWAGMARQAIRSVARR
jgi:tellurite resistance protein TerC